MGYTHYWRIWYPIDVATWNVIVVDVEKILKNQARWVCHEFDRPLHAPRCTKACTTVASAAVHALASDADGEIMFNGKGKHGHETFLVERVPNSERRVIANGMTFNFCKTAQKEYDLAVMACLIVLKKHLGDACKLTSDGTWLEDWQPGAALVRRVLGYSEADEAGAWRDLT